MDTWIGVNLKSSAADISLIGIGWCKIDVPFSIVIYNKLEHTVAIRRPEGQAVFPRFTGGF